MSIHAMNAKMSTSTQFGSMAKKEEKTVRVQILMPETLRNQFKGVTASEGKTMGEVLTDFVQGYVKKKRSEMASHEENEWRDR